MNKATACWVRGGGTTPNGGRGGGGGGGDGGGDGGGGGGGGGRRRSRRLRCVFTANDIPCSVFTSTLCCQKNTFKYSFLV